VLRILSLFLAFGLPFLLGYGVLPLLNFINEVASLLGLGFVMLVASLEPARLRWNWRYLLVLGALAVLLGLTAWQALRASAAGMWELYATTAGYLLVAALTFHLGWSRGQDAASRDRWVMAFCRAVSLAGLLAALAGLVQYANLSTVWGLLPYLDTAGRAFGFVRQPNHQATFLAIGILCAGLLVSRGALRRDVGALVVMVMAAGVLASGSRMGFGLLALEGAWMAISFGPRVRRVVLALAIAVPCLVAMLWLLHLYGHVPFYGVAKVRQSLNEGAGVRTQLWIEAARFIAQAPWTGVGLHRFGQMFFLSDAALHTRVVMGNAHNVLLQLAFDFGIPATLLAGAAVACALAGGARAWREPERALALGIVGCVGVHAMLEFPLWYIHFLAITMFMLGVAASASAPPATARACVTEGEPLPRAAAMRGPGQALLAACGLLVVVLSVWLNRDYYRISQIYFNVRPSEVRQAVAQAEGVTWWSRYVRYAQLMLQVPDARNVADWLPRMQDAACQTTDPLYQPLFIVGLAYGGRVAEARRILYIYAALNSEAANQARVILARFDGPVFEDLRRFLEDPAPVQVPPQDILPCLR
jgi:hypothetical protein